MMLVDQLYRHGRSARFGQAGGNRGTAMQREKTDIRWRHLE
jgi:hypothetical protein